ncbi:MAG: hypothetical protein HYR91_04225 [Flavobacteriia bacterium]|nr:hypothetical protein [Flavobacteriia bacterium]
MNQTEEIKEILLTDCEIVKIENTASLSFIRKLRRREVVDFDFETHFEREDKKCIIINDRTQCKECHSISIDKIDKSNLIEIETDYHNKFKIKKNQKFAPNLQKFALIFHCNDNECDVESSSRDHNPYHHSLFKRQNFSITSSLSSQRIVSLNNLQNEF